MEEQKKYFAVLNIHGDEAGGNPVTIITDSKEKMLVGLRDATVLLLRSDRMKLGANPEEFTGYYDMEDLDEKAKIYQFRGSNGEIETHYLKHYISDDWCSVTDDKETFIKDKENAERNTGKPAKNFPVR